MSSKKFKSLLLLMVMSGLLLVVYLLGTKDFDPVDNKASVPVEKLVYSSDVEGNKEIYSMNTDGTQIRRLTTNLAGDEGAVWSPDGSKIAFKSDREKEANGDYDLYLMNADGSGVVAITNYHPSHERGLSFNPDGTKISFSSDKTGSYEVYTINIDGTDLRRITNNNFRDATTHWSPDGRIIAYSTTRNINGSDNSEIFATILSTGNEINLTNHIADDRIPAWSPNGLMMAFRSSRGGGDAEIMKMNADGSQQVQVTNNSYEDLGPAWSPNSQKIAFSSTRNGNSEIYIIDINGANERRITNTSANEDDVDWGLIGGDIPEDTPTPTFSVTPTIPPEFTTTPTIVPSVTSTPQLSFTPTPIQSPTPTPTVGASVTPTPTTIPGSSPTPTVRLTATPTLITGSICDKADSDHDGNFDIADFVSFAASYQDGKRTCDDKDADYGACGGRDVNRDGTLNIADFGGTNGFASRYYPKASCALP